MAHVWGEEYCETCGTLQSNYRREQMISNFLQYGFEKVEVFEPPTFYQKLFKMKTNQLESYYKYGFIIAKYVKKNMPAGMILTVGNKHINFFHYGSFDYVKKQLDKIFDDKKIQRRLKLDKIQNSK